MIEVNNRTKSSIEEGFLKKIAEKVIKGELAQSVSKGKAKNSDLSIVLVGPKEMQELNKRYRKKDKTANVLSFSGDESALGEVVICPQEVRKDAKKYSILFQEALAWMLIHGILHLLDYNHEKDVKEAQLMEKKEESYLKVLNL